MQGAFCSRRALPVLFIRRYFRLIIPSDLCYMSGSLANARRTRPRKLVHPEIEQLVGLLDEAYKRAAWHGPNLRGSIRGLTAREATWRPKAGRHNIWEIGVHAAYWKYTVTRRLLGEKRGSFSLPGSNWFIRPANRNDKAWRADIILLESEHQRLTAAVPELKPESLDRSARGSKNLTRRLIVRIAL